MIKKWIQIIIISILCSLQWSLLTQASFRDVQNNKYKEAIDFIQGRSIVSGYPDGTYRPNNSINRAELLTIIVGQQYKNLPSKNCFNDVSSTAWYSKFVCKGYELGIVAGYPDGGFKPEKNISFVEALIMLQRANQISVNTSGNFWFENSVRSASSMNIIPTDITSFGQVINRGQMAEMMTRLLKYEENTLNDYLGAKQGVVVTFDTMQKGLSVENSVSLPDWNYQSNYLIVTPDILLSASKKLKEYRSSSYMVSIVKLSEIQKGAITAENIDRWIENYAAKNSSLKYVVLLGDQKLLPTFSVDVSSVSGGGVQIAPTDHYYRILSSNPSNYVPSLIVGRIPLKTDSEMDIYLDKTKTFEQHAADKKTIVFFGRGGELQYARDRDEPHARNLGFNTVILDDPSEDAIYEYLNANSNKVAVMLYYGHGNWFSNAPLNEDRLQRWVTQDIPMLYLSGGCGFGDAPADQRSLSEVFLMQKIGAVGTMGASVNGGYGADYQFTTAFLNALNSQKTLGDTYQDAILNHYFYSQTIPLPPAGSGSYAPDIFTKFFIYRMSLLGDPALKIR